MCVYTPFAYRAAVIAVVLMLVSSSGTWRTLLHGWRRLGLHSIRYTGIQQSSASTIGIHLQLFHTLHTCTTYMHTHSLSGSILWPWHWQWPCTASVVWRAYERDGSEDSRAPARAAATDWQAEEQGRLCVTSHFHRHLHPLKAVSKRMRFIIVQ